MPHRTQQKASTAEVNLGATLRVAPGVSVYGEVSYNRNLDVMRTTVTRARWG
jgi:hypothetical protein